MSDTYKIGFLGCAGTGRTVVASDLASQMSLPLLLSRTITHPILVRDGYKYASGMQVEEFLAAEGRELELINMRVEQETELGNFVTDRTIIDHFAYLLLSPENVLDEDMMRLFDLCQRHAKTYTHLLHIPWPNTKPRDNGMRTINRWYQLSVDAVIRGLCQAWGLRVFECEPNVDGDTLLKTVEEWDALWQ